MRVIKTTGILPHRTCLKRSGLLSLQKKWLKEDVEQVNKIICALEK